MADLKDLDWELKNRSGHNDALTPEGLHKFCKGDAGLYSAYTSMKGSDVHARLVGGMDDKDMVDTHGGGIPTPKGRGSATSKGARTPKGVETINVNHNHGASEDLVEAELQVAEDRKLDMLYAREAALNTQKSAKDVTPDSKMFYSEELTSTRKEISSTKRKLLIDRDLRASKKFNTP